MLRRTFPVFRWKFLSKTKKVPGGNASVDIQKLAQCNSFFYLFQLTAHIPVWMASDIFVASNFRKRYTVMPASNPEILIRSGIEKCRHGQYELALKDFNDAARYGFNEELLYNRSKALFKLRRMNEALADLNSLIGMYPDNPVWYSERAVIFHYNKDAEKTLQDLDKAVLLDPENGFRYSSRAFIKDAYGDLKGALADYEKAISLDPDDAISYNNKGLVEEKLGYPDRAKVSFMNADSLASNYSGQTPSSENILSPNRLPEDMEYKEITRKKMTFRHFFDTLLGVVGSKKGVQSFLNFIFGKN